LAEAVICGLGPDGYLYALTTAAKAAKAVAA
jgi:3-dehydroquinate dehydratase